MNHSKLGKNIVCISLVRILQFPYVQLEFLTLTRIRLINIYYFSYTRLLTREVDHSHL